MDVIADGTRRSPPAGAGVGIVGYCWGGTVAWLAAARVDGLACAIAYYGGGMPTAIGEKPAARCSRTSASRTR
jgi:dienelactone hydrolase